MHSFSEIIYSFSIKAGKCVSNDFAIFDINNLIAIESKIIPKIFLKTAIPDDPKSLSMYFVVLRTINTTTIFRINPIRISIAEYSALNDSKVVIDPAPAIIGNANGTIEAPSGVDPLKTSIPNTISSARKNNIKEPAIAKDAISTPNIPSIASPTNKNNVSITKDTTVVFKACILFPLVFKSIIIGIEPTMSITANITIKTDKMSNILIVIFDIFKRY